MALKVDMQEILAAKDVDLEVLYRVIERLGIKKLPVKIAYNPDDPASVIYTNKKKSLFEMYGFECELVDSFAWFENNCSTMVQLPMEDSQSLINRINPRFDIDGLTEENVYKLFTNNGKGFLPATVASIDYIATHELGDLRGKRALIVGKSTIVGKPLALHWMNKGVSVSICGKDETCLKDLIENVDIVVLATPVPKLLSSSDFPYELNDCLIIDAGICKDESGKVVGNFNDDDDEFDETPIYYTPVPGGVGPLTVRCLVENHMIACIKNQSYIE